MGCAQQKPSQPKKIPMAQLKRPNTNTTIRNKKQQQIQDFQSLNSIKPKLMPILTGQKDYNPRQQNYLKYKQAVKLPLQKDNHDIGKILNDAVFNIEKSRQMIPDMSKYKVPKITYPKLDLSSIQRKRREKTELIKE